MSDSNTSFDWSQLSEDIPHQAVFSSTDEEQDISHQAVFSSTNEEQDISLLDSDQIEEEVNVDYYGFLPNRLKKFPKFLLFGVIFLPIAIIYSINYWNNTPTPQPSSAEPSSDESSSDDTLVAENQRLREDKERLKAEQALGSQQRHLQSSSTPTPVSTPVSSTPKPVSTPVPSSTPVSSTPKPVSTPVPSPQIVYRTRTVEKPVVRERVVYRSRSAPPAPPPAPLSQASPSSSTPPPTSWQSQYQDPQSAWIAASQLGSYGGGTSPTNSRSSLPQTNTEAQNPESSPILAQNTTSQSDLEQSVLQGFPRQVIDIPSGTKLKARLQQAIVWDDPNFVKGAIIPLQLTEDLQDASGEVLLSSGEMVNAVVFEARPSGIVVMGLKELPFAQLEMGTAIIQQFDGMPLVAQNQNPSPPNQQGINGVALGFDLIGAVAPMLQNSGSNEFYRDAYQLQQWEGLYNRHFQQNNQRSFQPSLPTQAIWAIPAGLEVQIVFQRPVRAYHD